MDTTEDKLRSGSAASDRIRTNIRGTRREMDQTLNRLGERLRPGNLIEELFHMFRSSNGGHEAGERIALVSKQLGRGIRRQLREHPLPAFVIGAGIAWWISEAVAEDEEIEARGSGIYPSAGEGPSAAEKTAGLASAAKEKIAGAASAVGERLSNAASGVASAAGERAAGAGSAAGRSMRHHAQRAREGLRHAGDENPLAVGGAFLAAGLLAGLLFPRSEREDEWMGEASDQLKEQARATGEELVEQVGTGSAASD